MIKLIDYKNLMKEGTLVKINNEKVFFENKLVGKLDFNSIPEELCEEYAESFEITPYKLGVVKMIENEMWISLVRFVDIHGHTGYSLLDGGVKVSDKVKKSSYFTAITDHGNMFGGIEFYKAMKNANKQPIIGCEVYVEDFDSMESKERNHLILLVKNQIGYKNLCKIISSAEQNFYKRPIVKYDVLRAHNEGLICSSACLGGEISRNLQNDCYDRALEVAENLQEIFGEDLYIEVQHHGIEIEEKVVNPGLFKIAKELNIKTIGAIDSHYLNAEDAYAHEVLLCIQTKSTINDVEHYKFEGTGYHIHSEIEFERKFKDTPECIYNLYEIAQKIDFDFKLGEVFMPAFPVPAEFKDENSYFEYLCHKGFEERYAHLDKDSEDYKLRVERLDYEISVIENMKYPGYFLIVWDYINFAKENNIPVGPGRGSAVGSIVAYSLKITNIDPIPYDLLFERFLNPDRISLPDIDIDFADDRRHEVIEYVKNKYGAERVSGIITFGTLAARAVIKDVGRVLDMEYAFVDKVSKMVPAEPKMTIEKALNTNPELKKMYEEDARVKELLDISKKLEGLPRHKSQHACGKVISLLPISDVCPEAMLEDPETKIKTRTAAFNMVELEELGLIKMDFLGLRNMSVLGHTIDHLRSKGIDITEDSIPVNDPYVYRLISTGETLGIFQIESDGMQQLMKQMFSDVSKRIVAIEKEFGCKGFYKIKAKEGANIEMYKKAMGKLGTELFERLIAAISLYRPGPMDYIPDYIKGMLDPSTIVYDTPELEEILSRTYGVIVYQGATRSSLK